MGDASTWSAANARHTDLCTLLAAWALTLLREAFRRGLGYGVWWNRDVDFEPLRDCAPFQELLRPNGQGARRRTHLAN